MPAAEQRRGLNGPYGLLVGIMGQAYYDALLEAGEEKSDALAYFRSQLYRHHLELLDLPPHLIPPALRQELTDSDAPEPF